MRNTVLLLLLLGLQARGQLTISPDPALVTPGGKVQFELEEGRTYEQVQWQVLPPDLGHIDQAGLFTASTKPGQGAVRAVVLKDGRKLVGHALVRVSAIENARLRVEISPQNPVLRQDISQNFQAKAYGPDGSEVVPEKWEWKVVPNSLGSITADGLFTPASASRGRIIAIARYGRAVGLGQTGITVVPQSFAGRISLTIQPQRIRLKPGATASLNIAVADQQGQPIPAVLEPQVSPPWLGILDPSGRFTAGDRPGTGLIKITAEYQGSRAQARALVTVASQAQRYQVQLRPKLSTLSLQQSLELRPICYDGEHRQVQPPYWVWKVVPEELGVVTPEGIFTAGNRVISGKVVVSLPPEFGSGSDFASIKIKPGQPYIVRISPSKALTGPGETVQFTAAVQTSDGRPLNDLVLRWRVYPEGLGSITQSGLFTAGSMPKIGAVIAEVPPSDGGGRGYAMVAVSNFQVAITGPRPRYLNAGESHRFAAELCDRQGNPIPGAQFQWSSSSPSPNFGSIDPASGLFTAGHPLAQQVEGMVYVRARLEGHVVGGDGIKVVVHRP
jgi:hypothetical protein